MSLEQRYRRLLRAYPRSYRARRGEEMLGTLLESAAPGQTRPTRREAADLLAGALRERLGLHALPQFEAGLRIAGPIGLVLATATSVGGYVGGGRGIGSIVVGAAWLLALAGRELVPRLSGLPVLAWLVTLGALGLDVAGWLPGSAEALPRTTAFGLIAALGCAVTRPVPSIVERIAAPSLAAGLIAMTALWAQGVFVPLWPGLVWLVPVTVLAVGALRPPAQRSTAWAWAAAVLLVPLPLALSSIPMIGVLDQQGGLVLTPFLAALLALMVYLAARQRTAIPPDQGTGSLAAVGAFSLGVAAGVCAGAVVLGLGGLFAGRWLGGTARGDLLLLALPIAAALIGLVPRLRLPAVGLALVGMALLLAGGRMTTVQPTLVTVVALLLIVGVAAGNDRSPGRVLVGAFAAAGLTVWSGAAWPPDGFLARAWGPNYALEVQLTAVPLLAGIVLIPALVWAVIVIVRSRSLRPGPAITLFVSLGWLVMMSRPAVSLDARLLVGIVIGVVLALVVRRAAPAEADLKR